MKNDLVTIKTSDLFNEYHYLIPIYQRNFAWTALEIEQLIEDIASSEGNYYLGNLIVNYRPTDDVYEVIDGQQRLTTLYLLGKYLGQPLKPQALRFEAREQSNLTLNLARFDEVETVHNERLTPEIVRGYHVIKSYFEGKALDQVAFAERLDSVAMVQVQLPQGIDLNHYFEIMNTRGEQLELHEIAKAKLLEVLATDEERDVAALIWERCSQMDGYVQSRFPTATRNHLYTDDWSLLQPELTDFASVQAVIAENDQLSQLTDKRSLLTMLSRNTIDQQAASEAEADQRFESVLSFTDFLLQVNAVLKGQSEEEASLDDKNFLANLAWAWASPEEAKRFLYYVLKCRVLYDRFIVKREYLEGSETDARWSLQRLHKEKGQTIGYRSSIAADNKTLEVLQATLRVTYTSPNTMHWITLVLTNLLEDEQTDLIALLEAYSMKKVHEANVTAYEEQGGFAFERIVFTYLDYLIYRDGYEYHGTELIPARPSYYHVQFRSSIEHLYPQHPLNKPVWEDEHLHSFGNLVLITISDNAGFSNLPPESKVRKDHRINEISLKLKIMEALIERDKDGWTKQKAAQHKDEMFRILRNNGTQRVKQYSLADDLF